jgi:hypothetical protein
MRPPSQPDLHRSLARANGRSENLERRFITPASSNPSVYVGLNTNKTVTNTGTIISWDTTLYDTSGGTMWSSGSPTRLVAPSDGIYLVTVNLAFTPTTTQWIRFFAFENAGSQFLCELANEYSTTGTEKEISMTGVIQLTANNYVNLKGITGTSTSIALLGKTTNSLGYFACSMTLTKIG